MLPISEWFYSDEVYEDNKQPANDVFLAVS